MKRWVAAVPALLAACASMGGMRAAPATEGASWSFAAPATEAREAACEALRSYGMYLFEVGALDDSAWSVLAQKTSLWSHGEYVRVTLLPSDSTGLTPAYFLTKRVLETNITATGDWSRRLIDRMREVLAGTREARPEPCEVKPAARAAGRRYPPIQPSRAARARPTSAARAAMASHRPAPQPRPTGSGADPAAGAVTGSSTVGGSGTAGRMALREGSSSRAASRSSALCHRSPGSFSRHRITTISRALGTSARLPRSGAGGLARCAAIICCGVFASNGSTPVSIS